MPEVALETTVVDFTAWISLFSSLIGGVFFVVILCIFKNFISKGFSWAIAEFILNHADAKVRTRMCKYFGNGDIILAQLKKMDKLNKKIESEDKKDV